MNTSFILKISKISGFTATSKRLRGVMGSILILAASSASGVDLVRSATPDSQNKVGVGVNFSGFTGISVYADTSRSNFVQAAIGFAPYGNYAATGDYAFAYRNAIATLPSVTPFWGLGAILLHDQNDYWPRRSPIENSATTYVGGRIPLGVNFVIPKTPVQLAAELAPSLLLTPATYSFLQGGLSARVLF